MTSILGVRFERGEPDHIQTLHPAYFALVMATGIVALAMYIHDVPFLPTVLFCLNIIFLAALLVATGIRIVRYPTDFLADVRSQQRGVGFFTLVAALGVCGSQIMLQFSKPAMAFPFWVASGLLWGVVTYGVFTILTAQQKKPELWTGLNGGWLVSVVATQSVSILTSLLLHAGLFAGQHELLTFMALVFWLGGGALYMWLLTLIFFRFMFQPMSAQDLTPPYWINMGAVAISTLAGTMLPQHAPLSPLIMEILPFVKGLTLMFWAIGTWWIPMLILLGIWYFLIRDNPFTYNPQYWGAVFPLGMYSVCTFRLADMVIAPFLKPLSFCFMLIAVVAWLTTLITLVDSRLHARWRMRSS